MRRKSWAFVASAAVFCICGIAYAQTTQSVSDSAAAQTDNLAERLNANTVSIISSSPKGTYLDFACDMATVLDDGNALRVVPIVGKGAAYNARDLLFLQGIDMGITQSDIIRHLDKTGELGPNIASRLRYITKLYDEEMYVLVQSKLKSFDQLRGKRVNFGEAGSGGQISSRLIFDALGVKVREANVDHAEALRALKTGEIAATILFGAKPAPAISELHGALSGFQLISVPLPKALKDHYSPAELTHSDYPNLIPEGQVLKTLSVGAVLAVFNWAPDSERYRRVANFTDALFKNFRQFLEPPHHPKWREVDLTAELPGWERFGAAKEALDRHRQALAQDGAGAGSGVFLNNTAPTNSALPLSTKQRERLFRDFLDWKQSRPAGK